MRFLHEGLFEFFVAEGVEGGGLGGVGVLVFFIGGGLGGRLGGGIAFVLVEDCEVVEYFVGVVYPHSGVA